MQIHEESQQPAEQTRVTPEEFAAAVARIEARKDATQRQTEATIPIAEAVRQLGLEVTPEEVMTEVHATRISLAQTQATVKNKPRVAHPWFLALLLCCMPLGLVIGMYQSAPHPLQPDASQLQVGDAAGQVRLLSEVGENQVVDCQLNMIGAELEDYSPNGKPWMLIKHEGNWYLRGWIGKVSPQALQSKGMDIINQQQLGYDVPVTLPLDGFKVSQETGPLVASNFHADEVHLDKHAWEKW